MLEIEILNIKWKLCARNRGIRSFDISVVWIETNWWNRVEIKVGRRRGKNTYLRCFVANNASFSLVVVLFLPNCYIRVCKEGLKVKHVGEEGRIHTKYASLPTFLPSSEIVDQWCSLRLAPPVSHSDIILGASE